MSLIDPVQLEGRLTKIESGIENIEEKLVYWMAANEKAQENTTEALQKRLGKLEDLKVTVAVHSSRWVKHIDEHKSISRANRFWDAVTGVSATIAAIIAR